MKPPTTDAAQRTPYKHTTSALKTEV